MSPSESDDASRLLRLGVGLVAALVGLVAAGCGSTQRIHYYQPEVVEQKLESVTEPPTDVVLAIEDFSAGAAYDEQRMVYRASKYKFDYYHYHRWAAPPGQLVSDTLREIYRNTGVFQAVVGGYSTDADIVLSGRVIALEERDKSRKEWYGRVKLDMLLRDAKTGELMWTETVYVEEPLVRQNPSGLTQAVSTALTDIGLKTAGRIADMGRQSVRQRSNQPAGGTKRTPTSNDMQSGSGVQPEPNTPQNSSE